ncbi:MAG TPA: hypothetical protein VGO59_16255 [Verrucomicrobiae bacterium]|jgi:hypothetical protein
MKYIAFIPVLFIASCASHPRPHVIVKPTPTSSLKSDDGIRYDEVVRPYYVGRSVDPNHPDVMAEQHPVYHVEVSGHWNLHPGHGTSVGLLNPPLDAAFSPRPTNDAIAAEVNQQREFTERVLQEAGQLSQSYRELQTVIGNMKTVVSNSAAFNARLTASEQHVHQVEQELHQLAAAISARCKRRICSPQSGISMAVSWVWPCELSRDGGVHVAAVVAAIGAERRLRCRRDRRNISWQFGAEI